MKKICLLLAVLLLSAKAEAQTITVPDANFRNFLDAQYAGTTVSGNTVTFTTPSAASITIMSCDSRSITDLTGIAAFTGLTFLNCSSNQLTSLNVSANTALQELWCGDNRLTSLNVSTNTNLTFLNCEENRLTSLNVSANTALQTLVCGSNRLTSLNLSANTALTQLDCSVNQLTSLTLPASTALRTLWCDDNQLTSLTLPASTALQTLWCYDNRLTSLNVSTNTALTDLRCYDNRLTSLNVSTNTALNNLECQNNRIPIILTDGSISTIVKDLITQVATFRSASGTPSVPTAQTGGFVLGTTGAIVNLVANTGPAGSLSSSTGTNPTIVSSLPSGIVRLSPDKFWTVSATSLTGITYNLILDLTGISGIANFNTLKVLKRANSSSAWEDVSQPPISATVQYLQPFIIVSGLTSFSDFAIGAGIDNPLPVELSSFSAQRVERGVELRWTTASEKNNAGFEVQTRSDKGQVSRETEWRVLGFVKGNGRTSDAKSYSVCNEWVLQGDLGSRVPVLFQPCGGTIFLPSEPQTRRPSDVCAAKFQLRRVH